MRYQLISHGEPFETDSYIQAATQAVKVIKDLKNRGLGYSVWWCKIRDLKENTERTIYADKNFKFHKSRWHQIFTYPILHLFRR